jgi:AraC family transcriptional regulator
MMSVTEKALWVIERNYSRDISLGDIANACGVSKFHLAHAFGQSTGTSVMQFLRGRRLSEAARRLAAGAGSILDLALESGYDSHEAFSRAFKMQFGVTPEAVRANGNLDGLTLVEPLQAKDRPTAKVGAPRLENGGRLLAVGLRETYSFSAPQGIAGQWQRFMSSRFEQIPNRRPGIPIGVATTVDEDGDFEYLTAVEVSTLANAPADLATVDVPPCRWAVFPHDGHISTLSSTYAGIWDGWLSDHGRLADAIPSIERHRPTFDPRTGLGGVDVWIPIDG